MRRLRQDLNHLVSVGLLVSATATALTGVIAHLWDLNDFWYHTYSGYVMISLATMHVLLNWRHLMGYARFRLRGGGSRRGVFPSATRPRRVLVRARDAAISRRGFLALAAGGIGGFLAGRRYGVVPGVAGGRDLGVVYHRWSRPGAGDLFGAVMDWGGRPPLYKRYRGVPRVSLPEPRLEGGLLTEEAIVRRRSRREYSGEPMSLEELSRILYLVDGIDRQRWGRGLRTAPSSGALYPVVHNVSGVRPGLYHYAFEGHALERLRAGDLRDEVVHQGFGQRFLGRCNAVLFLTLIFQRMRFRYRDRSYRYGMLEAGHLGQNLYLAATSMGLGVCAVGSFFDDRVNDMLGVDGRREAAVYMLGVGKV